MSKCWIYDTPGFCLFVFNVGAGRPDMASLSETLADGTRTCRRELFQEEHESSSLADITTGESIRTFSMHF